MTTFTTATALDVGQVREVNQDHVLAEDALVAVADGMGGHRGGEVASAVAIEALSEHFTAPTTEGLVEAVQSANRAIVTRAHADDELRGMGTTICALAVVDGEGGQHLSVVNVGDSRAYLLEAGATELHQISEDHSLVATLERQGQLTREEAAAHPQRNILTRALGIDEQVLVDSFELRPVVGDRYLLCSDGLFNEVEEDRIAEVLRSADDLGAAAEELVRRANEGGGRDNISVVLVEITEGEEPSAVPRLMAAVHGPERAGRPDPADDLPPAVTGRATAAAPEATPTPDVAGHADAPPAAGPEPPASPPAAGPEPPASPPAAAPAPAPPVSPPAAGPPPPAPPPVAASANTRFTWRVFAFVVALLVVLGGAVLAITWFGTRTYHVAVDGGQVAIFRGPQGGVLWIQPEVVEDTGIPLDQVPPQFLDDVRAGKDEPDLEQAEAYVDNIRAAIEERQASSNPPPAEPGGGLGGVVTPPTSTTSSVVPPGSTP